MANDDKNTDQISDLAYPAVGGSSQGADPTTSVSDVNSTDPDSALADTLENISSMDKAVGVSDFKDPSEEKVNDVTPLSQNQQDTSKQKPVDLEAQLSNLSGLGTPEKHVQEPNKSDNKVMDLSSMGDEKDDRSIGSPSTIGEGEVKSGGEDKKESPFKALASKLTNMKEDLIQPTESDTLSSKKVTPSPSPKDQSKDAISSNDTPMDVTIEDEKNTTSSGQDGEIGSKKDVSVIFEDQVPTKVEDTKSKDMAPESTPPKQTSPSQQSQAKMDTPPSSKNQVPTPHPTSTFSDGNNSSSIKEETTPTQPSISNVPTTSPASSPDPMGLNSNEQPIIQKDPDKESQSDMSSRSATTVGTGASEESVGSQQSTLSVQPGSNAPTQQQPLTPPPPPFTPPPKPAETLNPVTETLTPELAPKESDKKPKYAHQNEASKKSSHSRYPYTIEQLLDIVVERDASDLHITVDYPAMIRVDGQLVNVIEELVTPQQAQDLILPVLPEQKKELLDVNREVDLAYPHRQDARFRINAYYQKQTLAAAFRLIPNVIRSIDELNLPQIYHKLTKLKQGLVLVTGPTGSGKSTTLAAILQEINENRAEHIITIEDPVEYVLPRARAMVDQRELHEDTHSWEIAMRSALRQDPDVILVGEMRDYETIASAITLAETGHLVFATLHTNSAAQTLDRIVDVFPEHQQSQIRSQLSNTIEAVIAQRLIPLQRGGRSAVSEIMIATPAIRNLIREAKTHQIDNVIRTSADIGMISLEHTLVKMVRENVITMERAMEYAVHPEEVVRLLKS